MLSGSHYFGPAVLIIRPSDCQLVGEGLLTCHINQAIVSPDCSLTSGAWFPAGAQVP
jgi:hypothetical protein